MATLDHLVVAVADLAEGRRWWAERTGVEPEVGGAHPGMGTHNALASFGASYVELIAPDPDQPEPAGGRPFGLDDVREPGIVAFAVRPEPGGTIGELVARARRAGYDPGDPIAMSRRRPDGVELHWRLTLPTDDVMPFLIDWGATEMPCATAPGGLDLRELRISSPAPERMLIVLAALDLAIDVGQADASGVHATIAGTAGTVELEPARRRSPR